MSEATKEDLASWADGLIVRQAWVLHVATLTIGPVKHFYDGETTKYKSTIDGGEVPSPVLELQTGHGFVSTDPTGFVELSAADVRFYLSLQIGFRGICELSLKNAVATHVPMSKAQILLVAALRAQLQALEMGGEVPA